RHSVFISIGCSELIAKSPCEYDRTAKILFASSSARPDASSRYTRAARPTENASRITTRIRREEALGMGSFRPVVHNSLAGSPTASSSAVCTLAVSARPRELNPQHLPGQRHWVRVSRQTSKSRRTQAGPTANFYRRPDWSYTQSAFFLMNAG